jgi:hypothetical protein
MSSGPKTRGSYGPTSPRGQAAAQKQAAAIQAVKDQDMAKKMREAYENFQKSPEADTIGMKRGGKIKKMAAGGQVPGKRSKGSGSMQPMQPSSKPYQSPPKPAEQHFRDEIRTPVIPDPVKYPEYIEEVGEERVSGPRMRKGGSVSSASKRADGCAVRGKTKGRMV